MSLDHDDIGRMVNGKLAYKELLYWHSHAKDWPGWTIGIRAPDGVTYRASCRVDDGGFSVDMHALENGQYVEKARQLPLDMQVYWASLSAKSRLVHQE